MLCRAEPVSSSSSSSSSSSRRRQKEGKSSSSACQADPSTRLDSLGSRPPPSSPCSAPCQAHALAASYSRSLPFAPLFITTPTVTSFVVVAVAVVAVSSFAAGSWPSRLAPRSSVPGSDAADQPRSIVWRPMTPAPTSSTTNHPSAAAIASATATATAAESAISPQRPPFYARFARRPRTSSSAVNPAYAASTSNLLSPPARGNSFSDLLRSSSYSQVNLHSPANNSTSSSPHRQSPSRPPRQATFKHMASTNSSPAPPATSGSALGRMFRRYSQGGASRNDNARPSTRDRDSFNVQRNTSSPALDRDSTASPMRPQPHHMPRSASYATNIPTHQSSENINTMPGSRTLTAIPATAAAPASSPTASPAPAVAASTAPAQPNRTSQDANLASQADAAPAPVEASTAAANPTAASSAAPASGSARPLNGMHRIRLVPHLEATRSLHFEPIERDLKEGAGVVKVGRFTDRQPSQRDNSAAATAAASATVGANGDLPIPAATDSALTQQQHTRGQPGARGGAIPISGTNGGGGRIDSSRIAFKSKVVSRGHAEFWCEPGGKFFIRDTKSSSGTFLNHIRLSAPNTESRPFAIKDGDIVQLGVDYQGGTEEIYRCVKMRVELNRGWQREANQFNVNALRQLRALQGSPLSPPTEKGQPSSASALLPTNRQGVSVTDCCICLFSVTVCQALFIAPCSHVFHYKCIRPLLNLHHPGFSCPLCRTFADLDADVEEDEAWQEALMQEAAAAEARLAQGKLPIELGTPAVELDAPITAAVLPSHPEVLGGDAAATAGIPHTNGTASRLTALALAEASNSNSPLPRATAAPSRRKNDWARPDTAVGSSAGPLAGDETLAVAESADAARMPASVSRISAELGEMAVADRLLDENTSVPAATLPTLLGAHVPRTSLGAGDGGSPARRTSGPIVIGQSQQRAASGGLAGGQPALDSLEEGWPNVGSLGGFSPGLEESGTPLNHTFLSTLAEAPQVAPTSSAPRDFPPGRSAPAPKLVPAAASVGTSRVRPVEHEAREAREAREPSGGEAGARTKRSSDADDVDTAEEEAGGMGNGASPEHLAGGDAPKGKA
ncbi:FOG: FHA domain, partial [Moesziomyces antarcticus T-34]